MTISYALTPTNPRLHSSTSRGSMSRHMEVTGLAQVTKSQPLECFLLRHQQLGTRRGQHGNGSGQNLSVDGLDRRDRSRVAPQEPAPVARAVVELIDFSLITAAAVS